MCSASTPDPPPTPPPTPDYVDEKAALAIDIAEQDRKRVFAGLSSTIRNPNAASGVLAPTRTTAGLK